MLLRCIVFVVRARLKKGNQVELSRNQVALVLNTSYRGGKGRRVGLLDPFIAGVRCVCVVSGL